MSDEKRNPEKPAVQAVRPESGSVPGRPQDTQGAAGINAGDQQSASAESAAPPEKAAADEPSVLPTQEEKPVATSANPSDESLQAQRSEERPRDPSDADDVMTRRLPGSEAEDAAILSDSRKHTRRSFLVYGAGAAGAFGLYHYLTTTRDQQEMQPALLRRAFNWNASVSRDALDRHALAPTYPLSRAETLRVNGTYGLNMELVMESYRLQLVGVENDESDPRHVPDVTAWEYQYKSQSNAEDKGHDSKTDPSKTAPKMAMDEIMPRAMEDENRTGRKPRGLEEAGESDSTLDPNTPGLLLRMSDITSKLKRYELVTQFKCIEGWSQIVHWAGYRMADFLEEFPPGKIDGKEPKYVYAETPDGNFYNGYDMYVMRHPQTLLVTEMMGAPLTQYHGSPVRLHLPTKYGYKQIKRIGLISYTNDKPDDYWTKLGYDWFGGL